MRLHPLRALLFVVSTGLLATLAWPSATLRVQDMVSPNPEIALSTIHSVYTRAAAGENVLPALVRGLKHADPRVRARCVRLLGGLNANDHADEVAALLADPDPYVRVQVALALRVLRAYEDPSPLLRALANRQEAQVVRVNVAQSLAEKRERAARAAFSGVARDRTEAAATRVAAVGGLGALRAERELLLEVASDTREPVPVRRQALLALGNQGSADFLKGMALWTRAEEHLRGDAAVALARSGQPGTRELYDRLLQDPQSPLYVRVQATRGIWLMQEVVIGCEPLVREGLQSRDPDVRLQIAHLAREADVFEACADLQAARARETDPEALAALDEALGRLAPEALTVGDPDRLLSEP